MPEIVIGCSSYNGAERLPRLLRSLALRTNRALDWQVVIVDDGSPRWEAVQTAVFAASRQFDRPVHFLRHPTNRGISAGWNSASRALDCRYVVLVNDDVILPSGGWLEAILHPLKTSPGVGGVGINWHAFLPAVDAEALLRDATSDQQVIPRDPGGKHHAPERRDYEKHGPGRVMCPSGQLFAFRREDFDAIGGFDETMLSFFEESDLGTAMAAHRKKIGVQLNYPMCWHEWSATFAASPELRAGERMAASRRRYIEKWQVPPAFQGDSPSPFDWANPKYLGALPPVPVKYLRHDGTEGEVTL